jgi:hypothetical protein
MIRAKRYGKNMNERQQAQHGQQTEKGVIEQIEADSPAGCPHLTLPFQK